jgi:hypothetical protein
MLKLNDIFESVLLEQQLNPSNPFQGLSNRDVIIINANNNEIPFEVLNTSGNEVELEILLPKSVYSGYRWFADKNEGIVNGNLRLNTVNKRTGDIRPFTFKNVSSINTDDEGQPTSISVSNINNAINNKNEVIIYYDGDENTSKGKRNTEVYAYGISMAGNPVIRAYQLSGDSDTIVPEWKLFRVDRISQWSVLKRRFTTPRPKFNPNGDKSMKSVLNITKF